MSWDPYVDNMKGHGCSDGFIVGLDGRAWTTGHGCTEDELRNIARDMKTIMQGDIPTSQLRIRGVDYLFLRTLDNIACFKKKEHGGVAIYKSKTALLVGLYDEGVPAANCNKGVFTVGEYLESQGM